MQNVYQFTCSTCIIIDMTLKQAIVSTGMWISHENVDIKSMCEFRVIKCIWFNFGISSMEKNPHESHLEVNFMCKFLVKFILGILSCIFNGSCGVLSFYDRSSWLWCRTSSTRILMFSLLTTTILKKILSTLSNEIHVFLIQLAHNVDNLLYWFSID